jgi:hypothetical protein
MDNNFSIDSPIMLKAKFDAWGDYTPISELPRTFLELVKLFSTLLYPNNFSINYFDSHMNIYSIDKDNKYKEAVIDCLKSKKNELKLMITVYKDNKIMTVDKSLIKRNSLIKPTDIILEEVQSDKSENDNSLLSKSDTCRKDKRKRSRKSIVLCC